MRRALAVILALAAAVGRPAAARADGPVAHVDFAAGIVTASGAGGARALRAGDTLMLGELVQTGPRARVRLRLADDSLLALGERTQLRLTQVVTAGHVRTRVRLDLLLGRLWLRVTRAAVELAVGVPAGVVGIRGTSLVVEAAPDGTTTVTVLDGHVVLETARGAVELRAGYTSDARPGGGPRPPRRAPPARLDGLLQGTGAPVAPPLAADELRDALTRRLGLPGAEAAAVAGTPALAAPALTLPAGPLGLAAPAVASPLSLQLALDPAAVPVRVHGRIEFRP
jgi:hypothetical protein